MENQANSEIVVETAVNENTEDSVTEAKCKNCGKSMPASDMADHMSSCKESDETEDFDSGEEEFLQTEVEERDLSTKARKNLPDSAFALPGRKYPIHDESHARNALARAAQMLKAGKLSRSQYETIVRKVKSKYPQMGTSEGGEEGANSNLPEANYNVETIGDIQEAKFAEEVRIVEDLGTGKDWKVVLISPGISKNRTYYSPSLLQKKTSLFEGVSAFADHKDGSRSVSEIVGWYDNVAYEAGKGVTANFHALESQPWFAGMMREAYTRGKPDLFGFSINGLGAKRLGKVNNETCFVVEDLHRIDSVDAVINPSAGGRLLKLIAGLDNSREEIELLENMTLEELKEARPDLYEQIVNGAVEGKNEEVENISSEMQRLQEEKTALEVKISEMENAQSTQTQEDTNTDAGQTSEETQRASDDMARIEEQMQAQANKLAEMVAEAENKLKLAECKSTLISALAASELPDPVQKKLARRYEGKIFDVEALTEDINEEKETLSSLFDGKAQPFTRTANISVGENQRDRARKALDGFFLGQNVDGVPAARTLTEAYSIFSGKNSWEINPQSIIAEAARAYDSGDRLVEALSSNSWAEVLGDSITRKMLKDYNDLGYNEWRSFSEVVPVSDFRTQRRTRFGGYGLLPTVSEAGSYTAMTSPTDEEATYSPSKRGGTENITLEQIAKDDVGSIRRLPMKLARAAKITLYRFVFDMISLTGASATTLTYDSTKLFTTAHANSVTSVTGVDAALNDANLTTAKQKMAKQAAYNESTHIVGLRPRFLVTTIDNEAIAQRIRDGEVTYSQDGAAGDKFRTDVNVHRGTFELITVPYWGDDTDGRADRWVMIADPMDVPTFEIGFFQGREAPELFTQDMETVGSMFTNDTLTYKIRHIYGGTILDHRGFIGSALFA